MQILPNSTLGGSLGRSLGTGLNDLAQLKLAQLTKQYDTQQEKRNFAQGLTPIFGQQTANFLSNLSPNERKVALENMSSLMQLNEQPGQPQAAMQELQQSQMGQQVQEQQMTPDRAQLIQDIFTSPRERRENKKLELAEKQAQLKERGALLKETKPYVDALKNKEKAAKETDLRLKRMESLIEKGNLPNPTFWSAFSKLEHAPYIAGLTAPIAEILKGGLKWYSGNASDIEEFEKLSSEFVKNAKQYFGPRVTEKEIQLFMQTVPTLMQTDKGKKKLIENIRSLNELTEIEAKAARSIIKANGGIAPIDIEQQVHDKIGKKLDKVAKKFIER